MKALQRGVEAARARRMVRPRAQEATVAKKTVTASAVNDGDGVSDNQRSLEFV
jgi:hypothetical protein